MTIPSITIDFISEDFAISDLGNGAWQSARVAKMDKLWNGAVAPASRRTETALAWSDTALYVRFDAVQEEALFLNDRPQTSTKTMQLWEHDVCELFLAPDARNRRRYFEFEIAPTGEWLDLIVDWAKDEPRDWEYLSAMETFAVIEAGKVTMAIKIPWTAFDRKPAAGDVWLGNLFRQVGTGETRGYLAWSPTMTPEPQFHVPEKFGEFVFVK
ncbi:MAG TPA: carbohydrate-binding family 9-like protein [Pyrinomonadaceae bacterium]|nr:carbohydrate-binding family 9-like protein [Pyrinomonadaceae bacterium]